MAEIVEQINLKCELIKDYDNIESAKLLYERIAYLTGYTVKCVKGRRWLEFENNIIVLKQVSYLGNPHPKYKKRAQIPGWFIEFKIENEKQGKNVFFIGVYTYEKNVQMFNFRFSSYSENKLNNSSAHILINDIYQATKNGYYKKIDKNKNIIDCFNVTYLNEIIEGKTIDNEELNIIEKFNKEFDFERELSVIECFKEMNDNNWPDKNQSEWAGFYLEYRYNYFLEKNNYTNIITFQKNKRNNEYDFDLFFKKKRFYGDLKSSAVTTNVSPGNDKESIDACLKANNKFWYVIYEHDTKYARDNDETITKEWNNLRFKNGHKKLGNNGKIIKELSYKKKLKESITYKSMFILEINNANKHLVLSDFNQGRQPSGEKRKGKYMIKKKDIDNFIVYRY